MGEYPNTNQTAKPCASFRTFRVVAISLFLIALCLLGLLVARVRSYDSFLLRPALPYELQEVQLIETALQGNAELTNMRQLVVESAVSLNGKVAYFWGGKSGAIGFDSEWGTPKLVTSDGDETTGQVLPFGLDCSGFINWCFVQTGLDLEQSKALVGHGTKAQWNKSHPIRWKELQPGDFVFQSKPDEEGGNHVGIVVGFTDGGEPLLAHCAFSLGGCVITGRGDVFKYPRRPNVYDLSVTAP